MPHPQLAGPGRRLGELVELGETQVIGNARAFETDAIGDRLVGETEIVHQSAEGLGPVDRVEVLALKVLDERPLGGGLVVHVADQGRYPVDSSQPGRPPATLADHQLVSIRDSVAVGSRHHRLHDSRRLDRGGQALDAWLVEALAWLAGVGGELIEIEKANRWPIDPGAGPQLTRPARWSLVVG